MQHMHTAQVFQHPLAPCLRKRRVHRHVRPPGEEHPERRADELRRVGDAQRDRLAWSQRERAGHRARFVEERATGRRVAGPDQRGRVAGAREPVDEQRLQRLRRQRSGRALEDLRVGARARGVLARAPIGVHARLRREAPEHCEGLPEFVFAQTIGVHGAGPRIDGEVDVAAVGRVERDLEAPRGRVDPGASAAQRLPRVPHPLLRALARLGDVGQQRAEAAAERRYTDRHARREEEVVGEGERGASVRDRAEAFVDVSVEAHGQQAEQRQPDRFCVDLVRERERLDVSDQVGIAGHARRAACRSARVSERDRAFQEPHPARLVDGHPLEDRHPRVPARRVGQDLAGCEWRRRCGEPEPHPALAAGHLDLLVAHEQDRAGRGR